MKANLQVETGASRGRRVPVHENDMVQVGRVAWADLAVPDDDQLADLHFAVFASGTEFRVCDLQSAQGTLLNDQPVTEATLKNGDRIAAGNSEFTVLFDEGGVSTFPYQSARTVCDAPVYVADEHSPKPTDLAAILAESGHLYLLVRFGRTGLPIPAPLQSSDDYVTTNDNPSWRTLFPLLVDSARYTDYSELIQSGWADEHLVCLLVSKQEKPLLFHHLLQQSASFSEAQILRQQLDECPAGFVAQVMGEIDGLSLRDPATNSWRLYPNHSRQKTWRDLGLPCAPRHGS